ncbi:MAG: hypothetical protein IJ400_02440 [Clostridia bacterium]|nr:hypothetical protein [Clostridia bacterium]
MEQKTKNKNVIDVDIRDIARFLLGKIWIIAVVAICFAVAAFLYTRHGIDEMYSSTTDMLILDSSSNGNTTNDWNVGQNLTFASPEIIKGDFCNKVAEMLNTDNKITDDADVVANTVMLKVLSTKYSDEELKTIKDHGFKVYFSKVLGGTKGITADTIRNYITVKANEDSPIVSVTATTPNAELSAVISNAVLYYYESQVSTEIMGEYETKYENGKPVGDQKIPNEDIKTNIYRMGKISNQPSNISLGTNVTVAFILGIVLVCAILIIVFLFDDKLKTPDDVEKRLGLSVLGAIPEIE